VRTQIRAWGVLVVIVGSRLVGKGVGVMGDVLFEIS
jgi:hypothetical protein